MRRATPHRTMRASVPYWLSARGGHRYMPRCVCLVVALVWCLAATDGLAAALETVDVSVAGLYVGKQKTVEALVTAAARDGNVVRLLLGKPPHALSLALVVGLLSDFPPDTERYYSGKTVRAVGTIHDFRGALEMTIHNASDIQIVGAAPPAAVTTEHAATIPPTPGVSPESQERTRELEQRVRQLESSLTNANDKKPEASSQPPEAKSPGDDADLGLRLRKLEMRMRQLERSMQSEKAR